MGRFAKLAVLALTLLLTGCYSANYLEYDGLKPAEITVSQSIHSLVVVSKSDMDSSYRILAAKAGRLESFYHDSLMMKQMVLGCSDALLESPRFKLYNPVVTRTLTGVYLDSLQKIPWYKIREIAGNPPNDAVLALESGHVTDTILYHEAGWLSGYQFQVRVKTLWRLYRLSDFQSLDLIYTDTVSFDIESPAELSESYENVIDYLKSAMYNAGQLVAQRVAPWYTGMRRYYFAFGPMEFQEAANDLNTGKYLEAAGKLRLFTESKTKFIARNAAFNMAVACEIANNMPAAMEWLDKSEKLGVKPAYIKDYRTILMKRKAELDKLDQQMK